MPAVFLTAPTAVPSGTVVARPEIGALLDIAACGQPVVLVSADEKGAAAARAARFAAEDVQIGVLRLTAPPTLVFVLAAVAALVPDFALGYLPNVFSRTRYCTRTYAALGSVRGLKHPRPSKSLMRRSAFGSGTWVVDWQTQSITATKAIDLPQHAWAVAASSPRPPLFSRHGWPSQPLEMMHDGSFWGTPRWSEVTVVSQSPQAIIGSLFDFIPPDAVQCRSCTRVCGGEICLFCQVRHYDSSELVMNGAGR